MVRARARARASTVYLSLYGACIAGSYPCFGINLAQVMDMTLKKAMYYDSYIADCQLYWDEMK